MANGFEVDFVKQQIKIIDSSAIDADGAKEIVSLQQAGYETINARKPAKRTHSSAAKGKSEAWYKEQLSATQWKTFQEKKAEGNFFTASHWADQELAK